jgi:membrane protease subunit HflC
MSAKPIVTIVLVLGILIVLMSAVYQVFETEQVIITQFGRPVGDPVTTPGLHLKVPFIQVANKFEKRFLEWDGFPNQVPTRDKRFITVDTYARWRISDPLLFFQRVRDESGAQTRLDDILDGETRNAVARHDLVEVVRSSNRDPSEIQEELVEGEGDATILQEIEIGREAITREILERSIERARDLGIEILDLRFKRINYIEEVQQDVFARMIAERQRIAEQYRSEGEGEAARIQGERERELQRITSEAYRTAQEVRGAADAEATAIYAEAYNRDASFYAFLKSLETYELTADPSSIMILTTDSDLLRFMKSKQ